MNGGMNFNMKCPNCSSIFGATNADTCPECGTKLVSDQNAQPMRSNVTCKKCKSFFGMTNAVICPECGEPLD